MVRRLTLPGTFGVKWFQGNTGFLSQMCGSSVVNELSLINVRTDILSIDNTKVEPVALVGSPRNMGFNLRGIS